MLPLLPQMALATMAGYALGMFPSAYLAGRLFTHRDIHELGDGNPGAENVYLNVDHRAGLAVGAADILKGALTILLFRTAGFAAGVVLLSGLASVTGHNWPVLFRCKGGRGAATTIGVLSALLFPLSLVALLGGAPLLARKGTIAACAISMIALQLPLWLLDYPAYLVLYTMGLPALVGITHFCKVVLPEVQRTGHLRLRPKASTYVRKSA